MNPYVGLEEFVTWDACGIERGTYKEEIKETPVLLDDGTPKMYRGNPKILKEKTGNWVFEANEDAKTFAVKHLNTTVKGSALFTPEVFTQEVLKDLDDNVIRNLFELPKIVRDEEELAAALDLEDEPSKDENDPKDEGQV